MRLKNNKETATHQRSLFGRRQGRSLSSSRQKALDEVLPRINTPENFLTLQSNKSPADFFDRPFKEYWLEIGFGHGEHLQELMLGNPDKAYIGAEPFVNGMTSFLKEINDLNTDNIRVLMDDGMLLARSFKPDSIDGIYILNPDPWHKTRHHKRRLVRKENLDIFARILKKGGDLILTTDVEDLADWMITETVNHGAFEWLAQSCTDWQTPPENWIPTRYEVKGAKGAKKMVYLLFKRQ
ncbi:MAG: tRNA (guanosine(46)-N7)-methyltransferase TrmB [Alphaproteobacteria bacterium]|nr:tRNA (guanosine(46)-N7)-methyltransferase TrmB [Alphaproteobacteria bacterium]